MSALPLSRRHFLAGATVMAGSALAPGLAHALPAAELQLSQLLDKLWDEQQRRFPGLGSPATALHAVDWSHGSRAAWASWARSGIRRIQAIDATALPQAAEFNRSAVLDRLGRIATIGESQRFGAAAIDADALVAPYAVSPVTGPHRALPGLLLGGSPLTTRADADGWLAALAGLPRALDAATDALREDAAAGAVPPPFALAATLEQLRGLRRPDPVDHPLVAHLATQTAAAGVAGNWRTKAAALVAGAVYPALERQIAAITALQALPPAPVGAASLPAGAQFYANALAWHTGTALSAAEAHQLGLDRVAQLTADAERLLATLGLSGASAGERLRQLARRPDEAYPSGPAGQSAVLNAVAAAIERIRPRLPELFAVAAPAPLTVQPLPGTLAAQRSETCLLGGAIAGTRADTVYVNLMNLQAWPRFCVASAAFHGSIPAHLRLEAAASASTDLPALRRDGMRFAGCAEGWGLYAEQVAAEQGYYAEDPVSRLGYLRTQLGQAARLVADTGIHGARWSVAQAATYLAVTAGLDPADAQAEAETMALLPGRACAPAVGQAEWLRLRELARRMAGPSFDQRRFHQLIQFGDAPFPVLEPLVASTFTRKLSVLRMRAV